jgi:acyl-CoA reductase-like NAD-dependent aldehyde dehydrogenase
LSEEGVDTSRAAGPSVAYGDRTGTEELSARLLWVGGREVAAADGRTFEVENPATGGVAEVVARGSEIDVAAAVDAARGAAAGPWPETHPRDRARVLRRAAALLAQRATAIAEIETRSVGRPIREMRQQVARVPEWLEFFASVAETHEDRLAPATGRIMNYVRRVPLGVVGQITPWNHPLLITIKKVAPALAAGNAIVVKPSELAPVAPLELGRALVEAGVPEGVVNVVAGFSDAGRALTEHPGVDRIDLTGGTETGRRVAETAGRRLVPVQAELGGKTPVVVFDDVPVEQAVAGAAFAGFVASGQSCIAGTRLIVQRPSLDAIVERLAERARSIRVGDPLDERTQMGPLASERQLERVLGLVDSAREEGATVLTGGEAMAVPGYEDGHFMAPTLLTGVRPDMRIMREEVFGPVITVEAFDDEAEGVSIANDTPFGLGAAVWTHDLQRAHLVARAIRAGTVWVNDHHRIDPASPWGGMGDSGVGFENGVAAFDDYTLAQSVLVNLDRSPFDWFGTDGELRYS